MALCIGQLHPITVYRTVVRVCAVLVLRIIICAPFIISLIEFYIIMMFIMKVVIIIGIFMAILFISNYTFRLSVTKQFWFCKCETPRCFRPWTFSLNIGLDMLPSESFMSCLHSLLWYSTVEFQVCNWLSLRRLIDSCMLVHFFGNLV